MLMHEALDAGAILLQQEVPIAIHTTTGELTAELSEIGAQLLIRTLEGLQKDTIQALSRRTPAGSAGRRASQRRWPKFRGKSAPWISTTRFAG